MTYQLVQVQFGPDGSAPSKHARRYTYLAPSDWRVAAGDIVEHPGMSPFSDAFICDFRSGELDHRIPLKVLARHKRATRSVTVNVPDGYVITVVREA